MSLQMTLETPAAHSSVRASRPVLRALPTLPALPTQPALPALPAVVDGVVDHRRYGDGVEGFRRAQRSWLVDLDAPHPLPRGVRWVARLRAADHLDGGRHGGIAGDAEALLATRGIRREPGERLVMLAQPRSWGRSFDPLTAIWLVDAAGEPRACVLEVRTAYGSRHAHVVRLDADRRATTDNAYYVTPFSDASGSYGVRIALQPDHVAVSVVLWRDGQRVLSAVQSGRLAPLTTGAAVASAVTAPVSEGLLPARTSCLRARRALARLVAGGAAGDITGETTGETTGGRRHARRGSAVLTPAGMP